MNIQLNDTMELDFSCLDHIILCPIHMRKNLAISFERLKMTTYGEKVNDIHISIQLQNYIVVDAHTLSLFVVENNTWPLTPKACFTNKD